MITLRNDRNRDVMFCFLILYFPNHKIITVSNGSFRKTTSLILSIISLSSIQSDSSILHLILFIHSLFKSQTTNSISLEFIIICHFSFLFVNSTIQNFHTYIFPFKFITTTNTIIISIYLKQISISSPSTQFSFKKTNS